MHTDTHACAHTYVSTHTHICTHKSLHILKSYYWAHNLLMRKCKTALAINKQMNTQLITLLRTKKLLMYMNNRVLETFAWVKDAKGFLNIYIYLLVTWSTQHICHSPRFCFFVWWHSDGGDSAHVLVYTTGVPDHNSGDLGEASFWRTEKSCLSRVNRSWGGCKMETSMPVESKLTVAKRGTARL